MKPAIFHPKARENLRRFPIAVRREIGKLIYDLQKGVRLALPVSRPMPDVGPGVEELRVKDVSGAYRTFYFAKDRRGILVFHAFVKKTQKTARREVRTAQQHLKELRNAKNT